MLTAILHIFRYGVGSHVGMRLRVAFLVILCCFVLRRVRLTLKAVRSYGGEASPGIFYYMEYVYTLCVITGVRFLTRTISLGI